MQKNIEDFVIHPDIHWVSVGNERLQIRQPNGDNITFDNYANEIKNVLERLKNPLSKTEVVDEDIMDQVLEILFSKGFLSNKNVNEFQFLRIADLNQNDRIKYKEKRLPKSVFIEGNGNLVKVVKESLINSKIKINENDNPNALKIVVADQDSYSLLSAENEKSVIKNQSVVFFRWISGKFRIGPFVVPGETACLECAYQRELASNLFADEMKAYMACDEKELPKYEGGPVLDNLAAALITREIMLILRGDYEIAGTSTIVTLDPLLLEIKHSSILRVPRCKVCSKGAQKPSRNYRNLVQESNN